jgi:hypothetical protein
VDVVAVRGGRAAGVGAVVVAALSVVGGIVAVKRGESPGHLPPGGPPSMLARMPARGTLAADTAWLEGFAAQVADLRSDSPVKVAKARPARQTSGSPSPAMWPGDASSATEGSSRAEREPRTRG